MSFSITWLRKNKGINQPDFAFQVEKSTFDFHSFKCLISEASPRKTHRKLISKEWSFRNHYWEKKDQKKQEKWWPLLNLKWTSYGSHIRTSWAPNRPFQTYPACRKRKRWSPSILAPATLPGGKLANHGGLLRPRLYVVKKKNLHSLYFFFSRPVSLLF